MLYLNRKDILLIDIHKDLVETPGSEAVDWSTVTRHLRAPSLHAPKEGNGVQDQEPPIDEVEAAILKTLADAPFSLVRELMRRTCLSKSMVH
jgi:hypothetical protein